MLPLTLWYTSCLMCTMFPLESSVCFGSNHLKKSFVLLNLGICDQKPTSGKKTNKQGNKGNKKKK